jgi:hypothetical protein
MPARSKKQQRLMGAAYAYAKGYNRDVPEYIKSVAKSFMKGAKTKSKKRTALKKLRDFAKTKHNNLPQSVGESILTFESFCNQNK